MLSAAKQGRTEIAALTFGPLDVPRLDPAAKLQPLKTSRNGSTSVPTFSSARRDRRRRARAGRDWPGFAIKSPDELAGQLGPLKKRIDKIYRGYCEPFLGTAPA